MRRLVRAFAGRTYHIVGNLMSRPNDKSMNNWTSASFWYMRNVSYKRQSWYIQQTTKRSNIWSEFSPISIPYVFMRANVMTSLRTGATWSEHSLFPNTISTEIPCTSSDRIILVPHCTSFSHIATCTTQIFITLSI